MLFGLSASAKTCGHGFGLCLLDVASAAAGWARCAVGGGEVVGFVCAAAGDVEDVVDLLRTAMAADVAAAFVCA